MRRGRALPSLVGAAATLACAGACNALSGLDADYQVSDTSGTDGGTGMDVFVEPPDGTAPPDALPDGSGTGCPGLFCEDFERAPSTVPFGWSRAQQEGGDLEVPATGSGFESARGLHARASSVCPGPSNARTCAVVLWKTIPGGIAVGQTLTVTFRFRVRQATMEYAVIGAVQVNGSEYGLAVYGAGCPGGGVCLDENDPGSSHSFTGALQLQIDKWYSGRLVVTRNNDSYDLEARVDGDVLDDRASDGRLNGSANLYEVGFGAFFTSDTGVVETDIDDVIVERTP